MRTLAATAAVLVLAAIAAAASSAPVVQGDYRIGAFAVKRDGSLRGMIRAFGEPSGMRRRGEVCHLAWRAIGLRATFYNLGGQNPCARAYGRFGTATMTGPAWRTSVGLRIGDPLRRLRALFPRATRHGRWWWLVTRRARFGLPGHYPGLAAKVVRTRVAAFEIRYQAGGE